jgi:hypothetical protein
MRLERSLPAKICLYFGPKASGGWKGGFKPIYGRQSQGINAAYGEISW